MDNRLELHEKLNSIIGKTESDGDTHVYFQPPASVKMKYPAIRYSLDVIDTKKADNNMYKKAFGYKLTLIDKNPDSGYVDEILKIPYCSFINAYTADNLNHFVFRIYNI